MAKKPTTPKTSRTARASFRDAEAAMARAFPVAPAPAAVLCETLAAGRRTVAINIINTDHGFAVDAQIWWVAGAKVQSAALLARVYQHIADAYAVATQRGSFALRVGPEVHGPFHAGADALTVRIRFAAGAGTRTEAEEIDSILHDAIPAPV